MKKHPAHCDEFPESTACAFSRLNEACADLGGELLASVPFVVRLDRGGFWIAWLGWLVIVAPIIAVILLVL